MAPPSKALIERMTSEVEALKPQNPGVRVPTDLVTTSASGLDPDISPDGALFQVPRVAKARGLPDPASANWSSARPKAGRSASWGSRASMCSLLNLALDALKP